MEKIAFNTDSDTYLQWPNGVTLDMVGDRQRLYWIDAKLSSVYSCQIDDCQDSIRLVVFDTENIRHPYSITVFEVSTLPQSGGSLGPRGLLHNLSSLFWLRAWGCLQQNIRDSKLVSMGQPEV